MPSLIDYYNVPRTCTECGGVMVFEGVGSYHCEDCGKVAYDDYGKVRRYIEGHRGATAAEVEAGTGVKQRTIRQMLKDDRIEVAENSRAFLKCELCGKVIRSGRYCSECQVKAHRRLEEEQRKKNNLQGYGLEQQNGDEGKRRFMRQN